MALVLFCRSALESTDRPTAPRPSLICELRPAVRYIFADSANFYRVLLLKPSLNSLFVPRSPARYVVQCIRSFGSSTLDGAPCSSNHCHELEFY